MIVDTSVWIDHLRKRDPVLMALLESGEVTVHLLSSANWRAVA